MGFGGPSGVRGGVGKLRARVTLRSPVRERSAVGQSQVTSWNNEGTYWAEVEEVWGSEPQMHEQQDPETTHRIELRGGPVVKHDWSIIWNGRVLNVIFAKGGGSGLANPVVIWAKENPPSTS